MTISNTSNRVDYVGNGVTTVFNFTFKIFVDSDLRVVQTDDVGIETVLLLASNYSVTGAGNENGGSITLLSPLTTDYKLSVMRVRPLTQDTDVRNQGKFYPEIHEDTFDHLTMVDQQQQEEIGRSIKLPESATGFNPDLPTDIDTPNVLLAVNPTGDGLISGPTIESVLSSGTGSSEQTSISVDTFSGNDVLTDFTLSQDPLDERNVQIYIHGVYQQKSEFSVSGTLVTFTQAPPTGTDNVEVVVVASVPIGFLADNAVTNSKLASGSVTLDKVNATAYSTIKATSKLVLTEADGEISSTLRRTTSTAVSTSAFTTALARPPRSGDTVFDTLNRLWIYDINIGKYVLMGGHPVFSMGAVDEADDYTPTASFTTIPHIRTMRNFGGGTVNAPGGLYTCALDGVIDCRFVGTTFAFAENESYLYTTEYVLDGVSVGSVGLNQNASTRSYSFFGNTSGITRRVLNNSMQISVTAGQVLAVRVRYTTSGSTPGSLFDKFFEGKYIYATA